MPYKDIIVNTRASLCSQIRLLDPADSAKLEQWLSRDSKDFIKLLKIQEYSRKMPSLIYLIGDLRCLLRNSQTWWSVNYSILRSHLKASFYSMRDLLCCKVTDVRSFCTNHNRGKRVSAMPKTVWSLYMWCSWSKISESMNQFII